MSPVLLVLVMVSVSFSQKDKGAGNLYIDKLPSKEKRWALIIGVSQYEDGNIPYLPGANNDAKALRDALRDYAGFDQKQIILLTTDESKDRQPTKNNILRYMGNLNGIVPKDGLLLIAFSGHGIERQKQAFLLSSDTPYNDNVRVLERTALSVSNDFKELIRDTGVGQVIILLDACRNDPSNGRSGVDNPLTEAYKNGFSFDTRNKEIQAFATLYATSVGERAYEYSREGKGYFTWAFIEGLKGGAANEKGEVTLGGLLRYVETSVPQQVKIDLGNNKTQRPFSIIEGYKAEDLVLGFVKNRNLVPKNEPSLDIEEKAFWQVIETSNQIADFEEYLEKCKTGTFLCAYKSVAELKLYQLKKINAPLIWANFRDVAIELLKYDYVWPFSEGLAGVSQNGRFGYIDKTAREIVPLKYDISYARFSEGLAEVLQTGSKYGFIDKAGKEIIPLKYERVESFSDGLALVSLNGKYGYIDKTGREIIPLKYSFAKPFSEGVALVYSNGSSSPAVINTAGKIIISPKYDSMNRFSEGLAAVRLNGKEGFIDRTGKVVVPIRYDNVKPFDEGRALVRLNNKYSLIDKTGKELIQLNYDEIDISYPDDFISEGLMIVKSDWKWGVVDKNGKEIVSPKYAYAYPFRDGLAHIKTEDILKGKSGFIDKTGREIIPAKYDKVWCDAFVAKGFVGIISNGKKGFVDFYGNEYFDF